MKTLEKKVLKIATETILIPFLKGPHGIGKTSFVKSLAKNHNKSLIVFNLSAVDASDLTGLPLNRENQDKSTSLVYSRPSFLDFDVIFFDELDRVTNRDVKSALNSLFIDRSINGHALKKHQIIIAAGNQDSDNYETSEFDESLKDRICLIDFKVSLNERIEYFKNELGNENPMIQFIESKTEVFEYFSPRRLFQAASLFREGHDEESLELVESVLNKETARIFSSFLNEGLVNFKDLCNGKYCDALLGPLTTMSLINSIVNNMIELKSETHCSNISDFIAELSPEEKAVYFSKIKESLLNGKIKKQDLLRLNELNFFRGQKNYLKELI